MALRLSKTEQKKQKDSLKQFKRFLPTLQLKKQQLEGVVYRIEKEYQDKKDATQSIKEGISQWIDVLAENKLLLGEGEDISRYVVAKSIVTKTINVAGVFLPSFKSIEFFDIPWDVEKLPLWVDDAIQVIKRYAALKAELEVLSKQLELVKAELKTTTQRVNLFEKVKIPEAEANIKRIAIYLSDQQTASVVRGKIAKKKLEAGR